MKPLSDGCAANDEYQIANAGVQHGELVRDLLEHRLQLPTIPADRLLRPELDQAIRAALSPGHVLSIDAPGGYGKTHALVSALIGTAEAPDAPSIRWISLSAADNAPSRFLSVLASAFKISYRVKGNSKAFEDHLALMLVSKARQASKQAEVLVLDNLQHVTNPAVVGLLQYLVTHIPGNLAIAMVSRLPLPFASHTLQLNGNYERIGVDRLELTRSETFEFFQKAKTERQITSVAVDHLYNLTEGWLTPLALYRREMETAEDRRPIQESAYVERFLKDSVCQPLTTAQIKSLKSIAELDSCCDELFYAIGGTDLGSGLTPSQAVELGLPLKQVPGRGRWFRLNPLLQTFLQSPPVAGRAKRMLLASQWFGQREQFPEALKCAVLAGDNDEVVRIASEGTEALLLGQDTASLLTLRKNLPEHLLERSARLRIVYGWVHAIGGQFRQARQLLEGFAPEGWREHESRIFALKAFILRGEGFVQPALAMADKALSAGGLSAQAQLVTHIVRSNALCAAGRFQEAREANRHASKLAREAGDSGSEALAVYSHARIELSKGALGHAENLLRTGLDASLQELSRPARIGETRLQLTLVLVLWHQGRMKEADRILVSCNRHAEQTRDLGLLLGMALRVFMCRSQGLLDDAFVWIGRAERTMHAWQVDEALYVPVLEALKASCWLACGQPDSAKQAIAKLEPYRQDGCVPELFPTMPGLMDCLHVREAIASGDLVRARENLDGIYQRYGDALPWGLQLHVGLLNSVLLQAEKGVQAARKQLEVLVVQASTENFISPFIELSKELAPLMEKAFFFLPKSEFTSALGELFGCEVTGTNEQLAEPISEREQGVLELIAMGLSNQAIADKLHISLHTVKTHARRINAKLDVKSRTQAIVRARELGLL
ncbi:LuxR C-terminal-related transcriptional regulator [Marinobacter sp.]|uniref:LuxR C-terminal-related transcriptional regulator n=1 Tax=Marinobacter sp. TaxID=50741 RepID=UPI002B27BE1A|nr:LuxR C-terminal-related transcriptional regulator [Marinobacter sp.]